MPISALEVAAAAPHRLPFMWHVASITSVLFGNTLIALGLLLQKRSHSRASSRQRKIHCGLISVDAYFFSLEWLGGLATFLCGHAFCWLGLSVGAQMVLSCLNCWCIVVTLLCAPFMFGEAVTVYKVMAVALLILGCVWVTLHGPQRYRVFTVERLHLYLENKAFVCVAGLSLLGVCALGASVATTDRRPRCSVFQLALGAAMCAWYSVLSAKCVSGLHFTSWHHGHDQLSVWQPWAVLVVFVAAAASNLHLLNLALAAGEAVTVMPVYEALSLIGQIVLGGIFFQEFDALDFWGHAQFWFGVSCVVGGIVMVTRGEPEIAVLRKHVFKPKVDVPMPI